jgi:hypothetical protein
VRVLVAVVILETYQQYLEHAILKILVKENLDRDFLIRDFGPEW